ncbi:MAG: NADH-quinone oxidoreductase subunit L [Bacteroidales bacterium]|nr:NADH-quinone oxidoreductase subunit L [Bacteroidales bacterium]
MDLGYTALILLIPISLFLILGFNFKRLKEPVSGIIGTVGLGITALISYYTAYSYFFGGMEGAKIDGVYQKVYAMNMVWINFSDTLHMDMGILIDPISAMMLIVVPTISLMVHLYSVGYMHGEAGFTRFFAYLGLFTFSMLGLVLATNLFMIYIFWEMVGVSSYLLIGYYYNKPSAVLAAKKAFIVTRFADFGFLMGILMIGFYGESWDFKVLADPAFIAGLQAKFGAAFMGISVISWALIFIFIGGAGKSAMFPLHIWLPDAMEGPTPVSALIHAATMVVAGVFLVARLFPLFSFMDDGAALQVVAYTGAFTTIFAAIIAFSQYDIKRVLAFSTMSQIGYMMLALGVSGYAGHDGLGFMASMFHLFTHAMFKALLFLAAGSIIHAVHSNYMQDMGGLRKYMPITHITFLIAALAISGIPPLAGFFSKDEILVAALHDNILIFGVTYLVAGMTAFYMFRLYFRIFWWNEPNYKHTPQEAPKTMTIPLLVLAFMTIISGFIPFHSLVTADGAAFHTHFNWYMVGASVGIGTFGILFAMLMYKKENKLSTRFRAAFGVFYIWSYNKFYIDEIYMFVTKKIIFDRIAAPSAWFDRHIVDGAMNGIGSGTEWISDKIKGLQSGRVQDYAMFFVSGVVVIAMIFWYYL